MNRIVYSYIFLALLVALFVAVVHKQNDSPDDLIIGNWKEVSWEYEKVDKQKTDTTSLLYSMNQSISKEIIKDLIIHESEQWNIQPRGRMVLLGKDEDKHIYKWRLKGWGNILKLVSDTRHFEHYHFSSPFQHSFLSVEYL